LTLPYFVEEEKSCAYLPDRASRTLYEYAPHLTPVEYEARMNAGWRKFGPMMFRPECPSCRECRPIRIPIESFRLNRSQMRCIRHNEDLTVKYAAPTADTQRIELYNRYQAAQETHRGWEEAGKTLQEYRSIFLNNPIPMGEVSVWDGDALLAVALADITPNAISGVYHYHDPDSRARGLGTFVMLHCLELALRLKKPYAYFGYYVRDCPSLVYKANFRPCEIWDEETRSWRELT